MQTAHVKKKMREEGAKTKQAEGRKRKRVSQPASSSLGRRLPPRPRAARER